MAANEKTKQEYEEQVANCYFCEKRPPNKTDRLCNFIGLPASWQVPVCLECTKLMSENKHPCTRNQVKSITFTLSH